MSLYGAMRTSVSGMNAQAQRLSVVADNVANVNTTGYKSSSAEFSSLLLGNCPVGYESGSVLTAIREHVGAQGSLLNTTSVTDLAISGGGFFVVDNGEGVPLLTRAGSFAASGDGTLTNAAGYALMAYRLDPDQPSVTVNGYTNLEEINLDSLALMAAPTTSGSFAANLPSEAAAIASAQLPSANDAAATYTAKSSLITYDSLGREVLVDVYFSKSADNVWQVSAFDQSAAPAGGGFPYSSGPLSVTELNFDPSSGKLTAASQDSISIPVPGGELLDLDLGRMSQLATDFTVVSAEVNGNPPSGADLVDISRDGFIYATYDTGVRVPVYRIPLAHVMSPDKLTPVAGNAYVTSSESGNVELGFAQSGSLGGIISNALEQSTVDLASELTSMIDAQRSYSANSKVFQTGSELMDVLVNLKR